MEHQTAFNLPEFMFSRFNRVDFGGDLFAQWPIGIGVEIAPRSTPLFKTPGIFPSEPSELQTFDVYPIDETAYRLTWTRISPHEFDAAGIFQAIANREQPGDLKIKSGVYVIDPK